MSHLLELRDRLMKAMLGAADRVHSLRRSSPTSCSRSSRKPLIDKLPKGSVADRDQRRVAVHDAVQGGVLRRVCSRRCRSCIYQIWAFVAPGLYRREKRFAVPLLVSSVLPVLRRAWCSRTSSCSR